MIHVEMGPRITFCGQSPEQLAAVDTVVGCSDWYLEPEVAQHATCEQCLLRIFMLGDSAKLALARMGRTVEVHDAPDAAVLL